MRTERLRVNLAPPVLEDAVEVGVGPTSTTDALDVEPEAKPAEEPLEDPIPGTPEANSTKLRWLGRIIFVILVVGGAVVASLYLYGDTPEAATSGPVAALAPEHSVLVAVTDTNGRAGSIVLLTGDSDGQRTVLVVPPAMTMQLPGYGDGQLRHATAIEGPDLLELAVINELGIRVDRTVTLTRDDFVASVGPFRVDVPQAFLVEAPDGGSVAVAAGSDVFVPETAATLLLSQGESSPLEWLQRQQAVWSSYSGAVTADPAGFESAVPAAAGLPALMQDATVGLFPVSRIGAGSTELYVVDRDAGFYRDRVAFLSLGPERPRVEILNGTDRVSVSRPIAGLLIRNGYQLVKTDNADRATHEESLVIAQGVWSQDAAVKATELLGTGELVVERSGSDVVDVSIIVGSDLLP
jgi:hypothetical protein